MIGYIYITTNLINGKIYIGKHRKCEFDEKYIGSGKYLCNAIKKYGKQNFTCNIIDVADSIEQLNNLEKFYIKKYNSRNFNIGYNISIGGDGGDIYHTLSYSQQIHASGKGKVIVTDGIKDIKVCKSELDKYLQLGYVRGMNPERRRKISESQRGKVIPKHIREAISKKASGKIYVNNGISNKLIQPEELDIYIKNGFIRGMKPLCKEKYDKHILELSKSHMGKKQNAETRKKHSESLKKFNSTEQGKLIRKIAANKNTTKGKTWVNNGTLRKLVYPKEVEYYLSIGYKAGYCLGD